MNKKNKKLLDEFGKNLKDDIVRYFGIYTSSSLEQAMFIYKVAYRALEKIIEDKK